MASTCLLALQEAAPFSSAACALAATLLAIALLREFKRRAGAEAELARRDLAALRHELTLAEQRRAAISDRCSEAILTVLIDDLSIVEVNPSGRRLAGISGDPPPRLPEICQLTLGQDETPPARGHDWLSLIQRHRQLTLLRKDGSARAVQADAIPIEINNRPACQLILREVTDQTRLEQQLRQAEKLSTLGQMVCGIAHELCNPLAVVNGYVELLLERRDLDDVTRAQLEKMKFESNRASKLVKTFLSYAHQRPARREALNLNDVVQRALDIRALELRDDCVQTVVRLDPHLPKTVADFDQVQQILVNLIHNSLQAIGQAKTPRLKFSTYALDEMVVLKMEDNGPGIPREIIARVFEPFFTTKPPGVGTGLGLSIAYSIMAEHKGRIYYTPSSDGGAGFVLEFPRAPETPAAGAKPESSEETSLPRNLPRAQGRILILDDQQTIADLLAEMVRLTGFEASAESDPRKALERVESEGFDLVLSDYRMPDMNGQEFYRAAIAARPELARRIIFLTGDLLNDETHQFLKSTGAPYLTKPFHLSKVQKTITEILARETVVG